MPYEYDLEKAKQQAIADTIAIFPGGRNPTDWLVQAIVDKIVKAYIAGYKQCEEDYKTECGI